MLIMTDYESNQSLSIISRNTSEDYVELHASSAFSFLGSSSGPDSYIERAIQIGMRAMALTDRNGLYGARVSILLL